MPVWYAHTEEEGEQWIAEHADRSKYQFMYVYGPDVFRFMDKFPGQSQGSFRCTASDRIEMARTLEEGYATKVLVVFNYLYQDTLDPAHDYLFVVKE